MGFQTVLKRFWKNNIKPKILRIALMFSQFFRGISQTLARFYDLHLNFAGQQLIEFFQVLASNYIFLHVVEIDPLLPHFSSEVLELSLYSATPRHLRTEKDQRPAFQCCNKCH